MSPTIGSGSDRTAMELSAGGGLALLPWTRHLLAALWEQVRLLLQVIYCTFISVFQMFRFEVHLRITDESGQHLQHMEPANSFLFSSLFDGDVVGGSRADGAEALLSGLRADDLDLCRGLVDDLVSRTSGKESGWTVDFRGDWSLFSSSGSDASPQWSSEDDQNQADLEGEESRALWESLSACSDPYNPLFFSASFGTAGPAKVLATRSDSEVSWSGSDSSGLPEESEKLLELFSSADPYDPMCFTASTAPPTRPRSEMAQSDTSRPCTEEKEEEEEEEEEETEEEEDWLWNSFSNCSPPPANTPDQGGSPTDGKRRLSEPNSQHHLCPDRTLVPWKKPGAAGTESEKRKTCSAHKQVRFSPVVQVHVMRSWSFARRAARPGPWEEMARDRERFRRRVQEAEPSIGPCLDATHRARIWACRDAPPTAADAPSV